MAGIEPELLAPAQLDALLSVGVATESFSPIAADGLVLLDCNDAPPIIGHPTAALPLTVIGVVDHSPTTLDHLPYVDAVLHRDDPLLPSLVNSVGRHPIAAASLMMLLRGSGGRTVLEGLVAESAVYSTLQSGAEFQRWRADRMRHIDTDIDTDIDIDIDIDIGIGTRPTVRSWHEGSTRHIELHRPDRHNAFDSAMRSELCDALRIALTDATCQHVLLTGAGPSFCSGGDLDEFGSFTDPASAHIVRLALSPGRLLHLLAPRLHAHLHGACIGSGIEMPSFAGHVSAAADTRISLPEVQFGLIPGAGGTVSIPRRIGRHRTALLALTGHAIDATTALRWGLVDELTK